MSGENNAEQDEPRPVAHRHNRQLRGGQRQQEQARNAGLRGHERKRRHDDDQPAVEQCERCEGEAVPN